MTHFFVLAKHFYDLLLINLMEKELHLYVIIIKRLLYGQINSKLVCLCCCFEKSEHKTMQ